MRTDSSWQVSRKARRSPSTLGCGASASGYWAWEVSVCAAHGSLFTYAVGAHERAWHALFAGSVAAYSLSLRCKTHGPSMSRRPCTLYLTLTLTAHLCVSLMLGPCPPRTALLPVDLGSSATRLCVVVGDEDPYCSHEASGACLANAACVGSELSRTGRLYYNALVERRRPPTPFRSSVRLENARGCTWCEAWSMSSLRRR